MRLGRSSLYSSLISSFIPPFVVVSVTVGALLAWLYASSLFGGQAWINSSNQGAVPQVFEVLDIAGRSCFNNLVATEDAPCLTPDDRHGSPPTAMLAVYLDRDETYAFGGRFLDPAPLKALMKSGREVGGFVVINDRVVHLVAKPDAHENLILLSDVTDTLLERLKAAGGVEVELYQVGEERLISATWRGLSGEPLLPLSPPPDADVQWHKTVFEVPYGGYKDVGFDSVGESPVVFAEGRRSFSNFARSFAASGVQGLPTVRSVIYVPSAVMLSYTNMAIGLFVLVTVFVFGGTLYNLRRLTRRQIEPIIALSTRVTELRGRMGGGELDDFTSERADQEEVAVLSFAIERLEQQLLENEKLQRRMQLHERLESLGRLTGGIAHDFNNLLNIVLANCGFLIEDVTNKEVLEPIRDIEAAALSAAEMTRGLLAFSSGRPNRLDHGRDVAKEVLTSMKMIGRTLGPEIALEMDIADSVPLSMSSAKLQQILMNLVLNARDAADDSGVNIKVEMRASTVSPPHKTDDDPSNWILLTVADDGVGIDPKMISQIFDPFFSSKGLSDSAGTGLGLSVVYGLVTGVGGNISVSSTLGHGSTFSIFIPRAKEVGSTPDTLPSTAELKGLSVLLVEDDDGVRRAVGRLLERLEMTVTSFTSGDDALGYLQQPLARHVDLLVTDIRMPGMDGYEVADHCRRILTDVPIIFMTGYDPDANDRKRPRNSVLLTKPVGIREFLTAANELQRPTGDENELLLPG